MKKLLEKIGNAPPDKNGVRKSRWLLLSPTTLVTGWNMLQFPLPDGTQVSAELIPYQSMRKIMSLELTGVWGQNKAVFDLLPKDITKTLMHRVGRYPRLHTIDHTRFWWGFLAEDDPLPEEWWNNLRRRSPEGQAPFPDQGE